MNLTIEIGYNPKSKRLAIKSPFMLVDLMRELPSRRFDPKTKLWMAPLVKGNLELIEKWPEKYTMKYSPEAVEAINNAAKIMEGPVFKPFPHHAYNYKKSELKYDPMDHQIRMFDRVWNLKAAAWFAKMGTGKTYAAIHLSCARYLANQIDAVMIISPATLRRTWKKELKKYATVPYDFFIHENSPVYEGWRKVSNPGVLPVLAVSVEGLGVSESLYESACSFLVGRRVLLICDESSRIKNPQAKRTDRAITMGAAAEYRIILNGTPIALGIHDLFSQYEFLDPNIIGCGDYWAFRTRYIEYGGFENKQIIGYKNVDELMARIMPYTVEVDKSVLNLPPKIPKTRYIQASDEQKALFRQILKGTGPYPFIKSDNTLERMLRLRQVVGGFRPETIFNPDRQVEETILHPLKKNPKLEDLLQFIEDNFHGSKFIIWTTFRHEIALLRDTLAEKFGDGAVATYFGDTDQEERSKIEDRYCNDPTLRFFIGNPVSAGLGLTLISGMDDIMYYYSGTSAFIDRTQSEDRAHRIGQKNSVVVVDPVMEKTVDEAIIASTEAKMDLERFVFEKLRTGASEIDIFGG